MVALAGERGTLLHAEAVLLVRHDETEPVKLHRVAQQRVRADDNVKRPVLQRLTHCALLLCGHGAGQPTDAHAERREKAAQRGLVLLGEDLRRRHERALAAAFPNIPDARCGHKCFAGTDVALNQPVHRHAGGEVLHGAFHRAALRPGRGEGERAVKFLDVCVLHADAAGGAPAAAHQPHGRRQHEQLFKNQPPSCQFQRAEIGGEVDVLICKPRLREAVALCDLRRQRVRHAVGARIERGAHGVQHQALRESRRERVDRHDPPRQMPLAVLRLAHRVCHGFFAARNGDPAVKRVGLARMQVVFPIVLVEEGDVHRAGLVHRAQLHQLHSAPDTHQTRLGRDHSADAHRFVRQHKRDRAKLAAILIPPGKEREQVAQRCDAELPEGLDLFRADAPQGRQLRVGCVHRHLISPARRISSATASPDPPARRSRCRRACPSPARSARRRPRSTVPGSL